jgi:hypothetical protein
MALSAGCGSRSWRTLETTEQPARLALAKATGGNKTHFVILGVRGSETPGSVVSCPVRGLWPRHRSLGESDLVPGPSRSKRTCLRVKRHGAGRNLPLGGLWPTPKQRSLSRLLFCPRGLAIWVDVRRGYAQKLEMRSRVGSATLMPRSRDLSAPRVHDDVCDPESHFGTRDRDSVSPTGGGHGLDAVCCPRNLFLALGPDGPVTCEFRGEPVAPWEQASGSRRQYGAIRHSAFFCGSGMRRRRPRCVWSVQPPSIMTPRSADRQRTGPDTERRARSRRSRRTLPHTHLATIIVS